jgi:thimet oligopeptidase
VIALEFFSQFPRHALLESPVAMKYRRAVLEPGGSMPGREIVLHFLGRSQSSDAFTEWMSQEFEETEAGG